MNKTNWDPILYYKTEIYRGKHCYSYFSMGINNLCFEQNYETYHNLSTEKWSYSLRSQFIEYMSILFNLCKQNTCSKMQMSLFVISMRSE